jgi:hypothetical protein
VRDIPVGLYTQGLKLLYADDFNNHTVLYIVAAIGEGPLRSIIPSWNDVNLNLVSGSAINPSGAKYGSGGLEVWVYDGSQFNFQETASGLFALDPTFVTTGTDPLKGLQLSRIRGFEVHVSTRDRDWQGHILR